MHTTASDGRLSPVELVARAAAAGLTTISVTDHDTVAALADVTAAAAAQGHSRHSRHRDHRGRSRPRRPHARLFLRSGERAARGAARAASARCAWCACARSPARSRRSTCRSTSRACCSRRRRAPDRRWAGRRSRASWCAPATCASVQDAFDNGWRPDVPPSCRARARAPAEVIETIHDAGGVASFAHPGVTKRDELIRPLVDQGLDAIEVYHSDHTPEDVVAYRGLADAARRARQRRIRFSRRGSALATATGAGRAGRSDPRSAPSRCRRTTWRRSKRKARLRQGFGVTGS